MESKREGNSPNTGKRSSEGCLFLKSPSFFLTCSYGELALVSCTLWYCPSMDTELGFHIPHLTSQEDTPPPRVLPVTCKNGPNRPLCLELSESPVGCEGNLTAGD